MSIMATIGFNLHLLLVTVLLVCCVENNDGSVINFNSSGSITPYLTETLNLTCFINETSHQPFSAAVIGRRKRDVTETSDNVHPVSILIVREDGQRVASLTQYSGARSHIADPDMNVTGKFDGNPGNYGSLEVSWKFPTDSQQGGYRCEVNTIDDFGHGLIFSKNISVKIAEPSINDLVRHIHKTEVETLKQRDELDQQKLQINSLKAENLALQTKYLTSQGDISDLKTKYQTAQGEIEELKHIESGIIECGDSSDSTWSDGHDYTGDDGRYVDKTQTFKKPYLQTPEVHTSIMFRVYKGSADKTTVQYGIFLQSVDRNKFIVRCFVDDHRGHLYDMRVRWISFSK